MKLFPTCYAPRYIDTEGIPTHYVPCYMGKGMPPHFCVARHVLATQNWFRSHGTLHFMDGNTGSWHVDGYRYREWLCLCTNDFHAAILMVKCLLLRIPSVGRMPYDFGWGFFLIFFHFFFLFLPSPPGHHQIWSGGGKHPWMIFIFGIGLP